MGQGCHTLILFSKLSTKFHKNYQSFLEDITEDMLVSFFLDTVYKWTTAINYSKRHTQI